MAAQLITTPGSRRMEDVLSWLNYALVPSEQVESLSTKHVLLFFPIASQQLVPRIDLHNHTLSCRGKCQYCLEALSGSTAWPKELVCTAKGKQVSNDQEWKQQLFDNILAEIDL